MELYVKTVKVVEVLNVNFEWLSQQQEQEHVAPEGLSRVDSLVKTCVGLLQQSPQNYCQWLKRKDRVRLIREGPSRYVERKVNKALRDLLQLTISDLLANRPFRPEVEVSWPYHECADLPRTRTCAACQAQFAARNGAATCSAKCRKRLQRMPAVTHSGASRLRRR